MLKKEKQFNTVAAVCMLAFFLTSVSYMPVFTDRGLTQMVSLPSWGLVIIVILLRKKLTICRSDLPLIFSAMVAVAVMITIQTLTGNNYTGSLLTRCMILAFTMSFLGEFISASGQVRGKEKLLFSAFIAGTLMLCAVVYFGFLRGQNLNFLYYAYGSKNETAMLAATAIVLLLFFNWRDAYTKWQTFFRIVLLTAFTVVIFLMRCRSVMIGIVLVYAVFFFRKNSNGWMKFAIVAAVVVLIFALQNDRMYDTFVNGILFGGRDSSDLNAISSGRVDQIKRGLEKLNENLWVGTGKTRTVDCFPVSVLMQYGVFLGSAFALFSLCPLIWGLLNYKKIPEHMAMVLIMCAVVYVICGIFEENAPFGPGARCFMLWFLWGYLKMQRIEKTEERK